MSRRRRLKFLGTALVVLASMVLNAEVASAITTSVPSGGGTLFVFPTSGSVTYDPKPNSGTLSHPTCYGVTSKSPELTERFIWSTAARMINLRDAGNNDTRSYEHDVQFQADPGSYYIPSANNIPNFYQDTDLDDTEFNRGGGSYQSKNMQPGVLYFFTLQMVTCGFDPPNTGMKIRAQRSYHNGSCAFGYEFCVTKNAGWPKTLVPYAGGFRTSPTQIKTYSFETNRLLNPSFASGETNWVDRAVPGGLQSSTVYGPGAFEAPNFIEFNCFATVAGCSVSQDMSVNPIDVTDRYTYGALVRCPTGQASCPFFVALWSLNQGAYSGQSYELPSDGAWYYVELQGQDYATTVGTLRFEVYNSHQSVNLDVDMTQVHWSK